jgi:hypothetical protein
MLCPIPSKEDLRDLFSSGGSTFLSGGGTFNKVAEVFYKSVVPSRSQSVIPLGDDKAKAVKKKIDEFLDLIPGSAQQSFDSSGWMEWCVTHAKINDDADIWYSDWIQWKKSEAQFKAEEDAARSTGTGSNLFSLELLATLAKPLQSCWTPSSDDDLEFLISSFSGMHIGTKPSRPGSLVFSISVWSCGKSFESGPTTPDFDKAIKLLVEYVNKNTHVHSVATFALTHATATTHVTRKERNMAHYEWRSHVVAFLQKYGEEVGRSDRRKNTNLREKLKLWRASRPELKEECEKLLMIKTSDSPCSLTPATPSSLKRGKETRTSQSKPSPSSSSSNPSPPQKLLCSPMALHYDV